MIITSTQNPLVKQWERLKKANERRIQGSYLLEGEHLVLEAAHFAPHLIQQLLIDENYQRKLPSILSSFPHIQISHAVAKKITDTQHTQGIFAIMQPPQVKQITIEKGRWLVLDRLQDPGNVGTMIRTADATGLKGVILLENCADIYSGKVLRAMQGSHFHLPIYSLTQSQLLQYAQRLSMPLIATALNPQAQPYSILSSLSHGFLIMGNEGQGVSCELLNQSQYHVYIPLLGQAESLNVAVAMGICCYEWIKLEIL